MFDLVTFIQNNLSTVLPTVQTIATGVIAAMIFPRKTRIESGTAEFEKLKAGRLDEAADMLLSSGKLTYTELYKMRNYLGIAKKADEIKKTVNDAVSVDTLQPQNFDWHTRFFEDCGNISDDDLQEIWAGLLVEEIENPNTHSLRTMECLRNLSKEEALLFERICKCSLKIGDNVLLPRFGGIMEANHITYDDVIKLDDCGLVKSDPGMSLGLQIRKEYAPLTSDEGTVLLVRQREGFVHTGNPRLDIDQFIFTRSGSELYSVIGYKTDLSWLCDKLNDEYQKFEFTCGQIIERNGNSFRYVISSVDVEVSE